MTRHGLFTPGRSWFTLFDIALGAIIAYKDRRAARRVW